MIFMRNTQESEGLVVPGTERHARLFEVTTRMHVRLRQLRVFITRENASLARLIRIPESGEHIISILARK